MRGAGRRRLSAFAALAALVLTAGAQTYTVRPGDTLSGIAARLGISVGALSEANAIADPDRIRAGDVLRVPGGSGGGAPRYHVVAPGETLGLIAARYGLSVADLAAANGIADPSRVFAGSRLVISDRPAPAPAGRPARTHEVRPGETLSGIAVRYGVSVAALVRANGIADPDHVRAGARLTVPGAGGGMVCPVAGPVGFINDYGIAKGGGRFHEGIDLHARRGTPVVAPVSGRLELAVGSIGGRQFVIHGDDGRVYLGTHLDGFHRGGGRVAAGERIGTVGTSGNARGGPPHVHFEVHVDGRSANPYLLLEAACR